MRVTKFKHFMDSNVVLYLLSEDSAKADKAESLLKAGPVISVQVLNEVTHVCVRKLKMGWDEIAQFLELVRGFCKAVPLPETIHDQADRKSVVQGKSGTVRVDTGGRRLIKQTKKN